MKVYFVFLFFLSMGWQHSYGQENAHILKPILINKEALSGIGLEKVEIKDEPEKDFYQRRIMWGKDLGVFVVSTENWINEMRDFPFDEFVFMLHGQALVNPVKGPMQLFNRGDYFFANKGYSGDWEINGGDHLHYELSVIATKRADTNLIKKDAQHQLIDPATLSGVHIELDENGEFSEVLAEGIELSMRLKAESPREHAVFAEEKDIMIHLLSGMIEVKDESGGVHKFYTGDFFVIPGGCKGEWSSRGHGLTKYIIIESSL